MAHDQQFKELIQNFFQEFLELFLPTVAARLDFTKVTFLDKEVFTDFPEGEQRRADIVARIATRDGKPEIILLHTEIERNRRPGKLPYRMFEYYVMLRLRYRVPVYPVAVYLAPGAGGIVRERYTESLFGEDILTLNYAAVGLPDLPADDYLALGQPLAAALSSLMRSSTISKGRRKYSSLRLVATSGLDDARKAMLAHMIEAYTKLSGADRREFESMVSTETDQEVVKMINIYEERGEKRGILKGYREVLLAQLKYKFGSLPKQVVARVEKLKKVEDLEKLSVRVLTANSLEDMGLTEN